jgi:hypothetical protein
MRASPSAGVLVVGTAGAGCALLAAAVVNLGSVPLGTLAIFAAAAFLTELFVVPSDETSFDPRDMTTFTFSASVHMAAVLVLGPWAGALVAAFGVLAADGLRYPVRKLAFNAATSALAAAAGGFAFQAFGGHPGTVHPLHLPGDFLAIAAMAVMVYAVPAMLVSTAVAAETGSSLAGVLREGLTTGAGSSIGEAGVGVALAVFVNLEPWAVVALLPLVIAVYRSHERLVTLRRETTHALETFANVVDERDAYTFRHSERVSEYVRSLAEALKLPPRTVAQLRWAGRLHDLGKISVDAAVLRKPGKLDEAEWKAMRLHPRLSARLLRRFRLATEQAQAVEYHHERFDGRGYYGIQPEEIPLAAHFLVVADSYDAMTSDRPYRAGLPVEVALAEIEDNAGSQFHPLVAKAFVALQRGQDPLVVLTPEEISDLRRRGTVRRWSRPSVFRPELAAAGGAAAGFVALGTGRYLFALPGFALAAAGLALDRLEVRRAARLGKGLSAVASRPGPPGDVFAAVVGGLATNCEVRWAGLVSWREAESAGSLELEWRGEADPPSKEAMESWLIREAESTNRPFVAAGPELGRLDPHVAVPLRRDGELAGYLVVAVAGRVPRSLPEALHSSADRLAEGLLPRPAAGTPRLQAVAG